VAEELGRPETETESTLPRVPSAASWRAHLRSFVLPLTAAVLVPWAILARDPGTAGRGASPLSRAVGVVLAAGGLAMLAWTVSLFARVGRGTLAPWDPTRRLVVAGPYARVRNPMISGVLAILLGEALALGDARLWIWAAAFFAINHVWFVFVEEPGLRRRFGTEYDAYRREVPRWIPRATPWRPVERAGRE
jgi:protein-S-isoprenylcysteine O-methyltransferase Ste14